MVKYRELRVVEEQERAGGKRKERAASSSTSPPPSLSLVLFPSSNFPLTPSLLLFVHPSADIIFHSYHSLGLSLGFSPILPSCPLIQIDLFNPPSSPAPSTTKKPTFLPALQSLLPAPLLRTSTARELLLSELGEPSRKGGGEPNLGRLGLGVWMEWEREREGGATNGEAQGVGTEVGKGEKEDGDKKRGLKVEFDERGAGCWERDRLDKAVWRECGLFLS